MTKILIGEGGFGAVHMELENGIKVAIKTITISGSNKKDVLREIEILSKLKHPNIIQYYKFEENKHDFSIIMEYAEGGNLDNAIKPEYGACKLNWDDKKRITAEIARGLVYLHSKEIIHRDIKGANILLTAHNQVKLCDFGLAKTMAATASTMNTNSPPKGTKEYIAPELFHVTREYSARSDIFALGVVMSKLCDTETPQVYKELMQTCINKDPMKRPTAKQVVEAIGYTLDDSIRQTTAITIDAEEQYQSGLACYEGNGVEVNRSEALDLFRIAASMGHAPAQYKLGKMYFEGDFVKQDLKRAVSWHQKAADQGDVDALNSLGLAYLNGEGVLRDRNRAIEILRLAGEQGNLKAITNLGFAFSSPGASGYPDYAETVRHYRMAADSGEPQGLFNLSACYQSGNGVPRDEEEAVKWLRKASEKGHVVAQYHLADRYYYGRGVPLNYDESIKWYSLASEQGHLDAKYNLASHYIKFLGDSKHVLEGMSMLLDNAEKGHLISQRALAVYDQSTVVDVNHEQSEFYNKAMNRE